MKNNFKEKQAKIRAIVQHIAKMSEEERAERLKNQPVFTVEDRELSTTNQMLLILQSEKVSLVGGYRQWQANGRQVRKGEKGLSIWFPSVKKNESSKDEETRFFIGTVFDISQTEEQGEAEQ
jgi:antirestriction protein ArdC